MGKLYTKRRKMKILLLEKLSLSRNEKAKSGRERKQTYGEVIIRKYKVYNNRTRLTEYATPSALTELYFNCNKLQLKYSDRFEIPTGEMTKIYEYANCLKSL